MIYQIAKWHQLFETAKTRTYKSKTQGAFPLKLNGTGYRRLMKQKQGPAMYGCFIGMCMIAHQGTSKERDGYLTDSGEIAGSPYTIEDIALKLDMPENLVKQTIDFCSSEKMQWIITHETEGNYNNEDSTGIVQGYHEDEYSHSNPNPNSQPKPKQNNKPTDSEREQFEEFRQLYPGKKLGFKKELDNFCRHDDWREVLPMLKPALEKELEWRKQAKQNNNFVPQVANLQTWINQRRWEQELPEVEINDDTDTELLAQKIEDGTA